MDNEPSWCSAIDVVSETGAEAEAISSLFNIELLTLISDSEGATTTVAEEKDDEVAAANDSPTISYELALTVNVSLDSIEVLIFQGDVNSGTIADDAGGKVVTVVNKVPD